MEQSQKPRWITAILILVHAVHSRCAIPPLQDILAHLLYRYNHVHKEVFIE